MTVLKGIGLLGGTFDPVHAGHLAIAAGALRELGLVRVDFLPAYNPWQKSVHTSIDDRVAMIRLAIAGNDRLGLELCEVMREGLTYTIDTLKEMRTRLGPSIPLVLIIGDDQWINFHTWKNWREYLDYAHIAICNRDTLAKARPHPDVLAWSEARFCAARDLTQTPKGAIARFHIPAHPANSSKIRSLLQTKSRETALKDLESWLNHDVSRYISNNHLYTFL